MKCLLHVEHSAGTNRRVSAPVDLTDHRMSDIININTPLDTKVKIGHEHSEGRQTGL